MEKDARGLPLQDRVQLRQSQSKPLLDELEVWLAAQLARIADHKITRLNELMPWRYAAAAA